MLAGQSAAGQTPPPTAVHTPTAVPTGVPAALLTKKKTNNPEICVAPWKANSQSDLESTAGGTPRLALNWDAKRGTDRHGCAGRSAAPRGEAAPGARARRWELWTATRRGTNPGPRFQPCTQVNVRGLKTWT